MSNIGGREAGDAPGVESAGEVAPGAGGVGSVPEGRGASRQEVNRRQVRTRRRVVFFMSPIMPRFD